MDRNQVVEVELYEENVWNLNYSTPTGSRSSSQDRFPPVLSSQEPTQRRLEEIPFVAIDPMPDPEELSHAPTSQVPRIHNSCHSSRQYVEGIPVTLTSRLRVTQGHWKRNHRIDHTELTLSRVSWLWILSWPWNVGHSSLKVTESGTIWKVWYGFLFAFHSNYGRIFSHFEDAESRNDLTLKYGFGVLQGHWKWRVSIDHVWLSIAQPL